MLLNELRAASEMVPWGASWKRKNAGTELPSPLYSGLGNYGTCGNHMAGAALSGSAGGRCTRAVPTAHAAAAAAVVALAARASSSSAAAATAAPAEGGERWAAGGQSRDCGRGRGRGRGR